HTRSKRDWSSDVCSSDLDFLDVGQGDSALVTFPDGATLLVDGGGQPGPLRQDAGLDNGDEKFEHDTRSIGERVVSEFLWQRGLRSEERRVGKEGSAGTSM